MKIAIIGSRFIENKAWVLDVIGQAVWASGSERTSLVSGGSEGVDSFVHQWATEQEYDSYMFKPHFLLDSKAPYSPRDFFTRYRQVVDNADKVIIIRLKAKEEPDLTFASEYATNKGKKPLVIFYDVV